MYAIVQQLVASSIRLPAGDVVSVEKLDAQPGAKAADVLMLNDGKEVVADAATLFL